MQQLMVKSKNNDIMFVFGIMLLCLVGLYSCDSAPTQQTRETGGETSILIPLGKIAAANISSAEVVITASDISQIKQDLTVRGNTISGTVSDIPAGSDRVFTINGYDEGGTLTYTGSSTARVTAGSTVEVAITVRRVGSSSAGAVLVLRGRPLVTQGSTTGGWYAGEYYYDARITGEIENTGSVRASRVTVTVTLRDSQGSLLGRVREHPVGAIDSGDSEFFEVFIDDAFSETSVDVEILTVDVDIEDQ